MPHPAWVGLGANKSMRTVADEDNFQSGIRSVPSGGLRDLMPRTWVCSFRHAALRKLKARNVARRQLARGAGETKRLAGALKQQSRVNSEGGVYVLPIKEMEP